MTQNILRVVLRHLKKHLFYSLLNIGGLATGISVFLMVALYVHFEKSYEDFIPGRSDIYRVALHQYRGGEKVLSSAENYPGVGPALASELPEVSGYARLYNLGYKNNVVISNEAAKPEPVALKVSGFLYTDSSFLPMMQYPMKEGNARHALSEPFTAVISQAMQKNILAHNLPWAKSCGCRMTIL